MVKVHNMCALLVKVSRTLVTGWCTHFARCRAKKVQSCQTPAIKLGILLYMGTLQERSEGFNWF